MSDIETDTRTIRGDYQPGEINNVNDNAVTINQLLTQSYCSLASFGSTEVVEVNVVVPEAWQYVPSFTNSWVNSGTGYQKTAYYKRHDGTVELKIGLKSGTIGLPAFILPVSCRPAADSYFPAQSNGAFGYLYVKASTGEVSPLVGSNLSFFCNVSFTAADNRPFRPSCFPVCVSTKFQDPPLGVVPIFSKINYETTYGNQCIVTGVEWTYSQVNGMPVIQINNMNGLVYGKSINVRFLIIGSPDSGVDIRKGRTK